MVANCDVVVYAAGSNAGPQRVTDDIDLAALGRVSEAVERVRGKRLILLSVLPEAWRSEVCVGYDATTLARAMIAKGWMRAGIGKHLAPEIRVPGVGKTRLYCIRSSFLTGADA